MRFLVKRLQLPPLRVHPPANGESSRTQHDQIWFDQVDVILAVAAFIGDFEDVAKPLGRHGCHNGAPPLDQRVGGQRRSVNEAVDLRPVHPSFGQHPSCAIKRPESRVIRGCRCLGGGENLTPSIDQNRICESSADIDGKAKPVLVVHVKSTGVNRDVTNPDTRIG